MWEQVTLLPWAEPYGQHVVRGITEEEGGISKKPLSPNPPNISLRALSRIKSDFSDP